MSAEMVAAETLVLRYPSRPCDFCIIFRPGCAPNHVETAALMVVCASCRDARTEHRMVRP